MSDARSTFDAPAAIAAVNDVRAQIKAMAAVVLAMRANPEPEATANVMLAYRHLEDASMRLGKVIQALDGGVSVYDKRTTTGVYLGAPQASNQGNLTP